MEVNEINYLKHDDFLEHYGVPGMKWGVRKDVDRVKVKKLKQKYKSDLKSDRQKLREFDNTSYSKLNVKNKGYSSVRKDPEQAYKYSKYYDKLQKEREKLVSDSNKRRVDNKAKLKAEKAGSNKDARIKAEQKVYAKEMAKYGKMGSISDKDSGNRATKLYERLRKEKGKSYANAVAKRANSTVNRRAAIAGTALLTTYGFMLYESYKNS